MTKIAVRSERNPKVTDGGSACAADIPTSLDRAPRGTGITPEQRYFMIAEAAYFRALERNWVPGQEIDDWLQAEKDIDATLLRSSGL